MLLDTLIGRLTIIYCDFLLQATSIKEVSNDIRLAFNHLMSFNLTVGGQTSWSAIFILLGDEKGHSKQDGDDVLCQSAVDGWLDPAEMRRLADLELIN